MTTLEITLLIIIYVIMMFVSVRPFRMLEKNNTLRNTIVIAMLWPWGWIIVTIMSIVAGYIEIFKEK